VHARIEPAPQVQAPSPPEAAADDRQGVADAGTAPDQPRIGEPDIDAPADAVDSIDSQVADVLSMAVAAGRPAAARLHPASPEAALPRFEAPHRDQMSQAPVQPAPLRPVAPRALDPLSPAGETAPRAVTAAPAAQPGQRAEALLAPEVDEAVSRAFNSLAHTVLAENSRTLEDLVREMLRPLLKTWLDDNLPVLVERLVRAEIERVARGGQR
jgi:cell pole-organizing protein PopZ